MIRTLARRPSVMLLAGRPRVPGRALLIAALAALLVVTSLGLTRSTAARATVTSASSSAATAAASSAASAAAAAKKRRLNAWHFALRQRGKPYIWGGIGPRGFDCSGLAYASYRSSGVRLPRTTYEMLHSTHLIWVRKSQARRGDLAFFGTGHVELYYRGNWTFGAADAGSRIGFHRMSRFWHPTMYFRVSR